MRKIVLGLGAHACTRWKRFPGRLEGHLGGQSGELDNRPQAKASPKAKLAVHRQVDCPMTPTDESAYRP
jgi:hypothetical protein